MFRSKDFFHTFRFTRFFLQFFFISLSFFVYACQIDMNCRKPAQNELKNIKSIAFKDGKLVILSSPQDVLTWCSAFLSVFEYSNDNLKFLKNIELSGKIAYDMVWVDKRLAVLLSSSDRQVIDIVDIEEGKVITLPLDLQNIKSISSYEKSLLALSYLDMKIFFAENIDDFISSKSGGYFKLDFLADSGIIAKVEGKKYILLIPKNGRNNISIISQNGVTQNIEFAESYGLVSLEDYQEFASTFVSEVSSSPRLNSLGSSLVFNSRMFFRDEFLFIQAGSGDDKGVFAYDVGCLVNKIQNCSWFIPITSDKNSSLDDIFIFSIPYGTDLKIFPIIYNISIVGSSDQEKMGYSFLSILIFRGKERKFYFVDRKVVYSSSLYELVYYDISQSYSKDVDISKDISGKVQNTSKDNIRAGIELEMKFAFKNKDYDEVDFFKYKINLPLNQ